MIPRDPVLVERAKQMRREPTLSEKRLWRVLRASPFDALHFRRQVPFGSLYIADFASHRARIIVEADGPTHAGAEDYDTKRDVWFTAQGYRVFRLSNASIADPRHDIVVTLASWFGI